MCETSLQIFKYYQIGNFLMELQNVIMSILAVAIGLILIANLLVPIAESAIDTLTGVNPMWGTLAGVVVIVSIVGLIVVSISGYMRKGGE